MAAPGLIGRDRELAAATAFMDRLPDAGTALLIEGEAGIGKTSVWRSVVRLARERGYRVLACQSDQAEARLSFVGLSDLMTGLAADVLPLLPQAQRQALAVALLLESPVDRQSPDPRTVAVGLTAVLGHLSHAGPVIVAIDDLQWLDLPSARALGFAARRLSTQPIGWLCTLRTPTIAAEPIGLERALRSQLLRLELGALSPEALRTILDQSTTLSYTRPMLMRIIEASAGNPLFALEIANAMASAPEARPGMRVPVPQTLREVIADRLSKVGTKALGALRVAAALSHPTSDLVERASSAAALEAAEESGLLRVEKDRVQFTHPLYASAVYSMSGTRRLRRLHQRLAHLTTDKEERARHLALATEGPDEAIARALEVGAAAARARGAWETAAELLEQARKLTPADQPQAALRRALSAAEHRVHAGDRTSARALLQAVLSEAPTGPLRCEALRLLAEVSYNDDNYLEAERLFKEALLYIEDPHLAATVELGLSYVSANLADFHAAVTHAQRALRLALAHDDTPLESEALATCAMTEFLSGHGVDWDAVQRSMELEDRGRLVPLHHRPSVIRATLTFYVGRLSEAREQLESLQWWSRERGDESDLAWLNSTLSWLETLAGNFERALQLANESELLSRLTGSESGQAWALSQRAYVHAHRGDAQRTREDCAIALSLIERTHYVIPRMWIAASLGLLELSLGNVRAAWEACADLTELVEQHGIGEPVTFWFVPLAVEALTGLGQPDRAARLLEQFEQRAADLDRAWALAAAGRCRALLLADQGDPAAAVHAIDLALAQHARVDMPFERARTLLVQGRIFRRLRRRRLARSALEQALAEFDAIGAAAWAARARHDLSRLGLRTAPGDLTPTEYRVASLAASGLTNAAVAATLFVSPKTVQANLARIYAKLGVNSRAQLGAYMARQRQT